MSTSLLGFTVGIARDLSTLNEACAVRARAYGRHLGAAPGLAEPDEIDRSPGTVVLACRDKDSGRVIGTARIQRNHPRPLPIEASLELPASMAGSSRAEITRLAIVPGADRLVRPALVKACWLYAVAAQIRSLLAGARSPALLRIYQGLGFEELPWTDPRRRTVVLPYAGGLPHHVLVFDVVSAERRWHGGAHPWYGFMVGTWHPDIELVDAAGPAFGSAPPRPREAAPALSRAA